MGARGRLRIPSHLRPVRDGETVEPTAAERVRPQAPDKPAGLPEELSELWDTIVATLDEAGLLARCDGPTVEMALRHFVAARKASDELMRAESVSVEDEKNGRLAKHPADQTFRGQSAQFLEYVKQLGMSFAARARTPVAKEREDGRDNPFEANAV